MVGFNYSDGSQKAVPVLPVLPVKSVKPVVPPPPMPDVDSPPEYVNNIKKTVQMFAERYLQQCKKINELIKDAESQSNTAAELNRIESELKLAATGELESVEKRYRESAEEAAIKAAEAQGRLTALEDKLQVNQRELVQQLKSGEITQEELKQAKINIEAKQAELQRLTEVAKDNAYKEKAQLDALQQKLDDVNAGNITKEEAANKVKSELEAQLQEQAGKNKSCEDRLNYLLEAVKGLDRDVNEIVTNTKCDYEGDSAVSDLNPEPATLPPPPASEFNPEVADFESSQTGGRTRKRTRKRRRKTRKKNLSRNRSKNRSRNKSRNRSRNKSRN